jgi:hypothetical protein
MRQCLGPKADEEALTVAQADVCPREAAADRARAVPSAAERQEVWVPRLQWVHRESAVAISGVADGKLVALVELMPPPAPEAGERSPLADLHPAVAAN